LAEPIRRFRSTLLPLVCVRARTSRVLGVGLPQRESERRKNVRADETKVSLGGSPFRPSFHSLSPSLVRINRRSLEMSTSTPPDSLGDCVVCGTRTSTRCSECASNGTKWMYFCSREHQKLVRSCLVSSIYSIVPLK